MVLYGRVWCVTVLTVMCDVSLFFQDLFSLQENSTCDTHDLIACSCLSDVGGLQEESS